MAYESALQTVLDREPEPPGGVVGTEIDYEAGGERYRGYLAVPTAADGPLPAVLVVHDWLGVTDATRMRCDMLARLGYAAFAADVFTADVRPSEAEAAGVAGALYGDPATWRARLSAGFERMLEESVVDRNRLAAIGYCFGGSSVLQLARTGAPLSAVVSFHGGLSTGPEGEAARIRAKLLVLTGGNDPVVPDGDVHAFQEELRAAPEVDWQVVTYSGAMHAFTVPTANAPEHGAAYDERADRRSWTAMKDFFAEAL
ncbi:dienelactone hydrolase family protein [Amnibacterium sp.]|uniref:dienelactone hydrolase family protein n=1 Tax=Amnibacterium sp. TaxID=1872496 RepID=UPI003F7BB462